MNRRRLHWALENAALACLAALLRPHDAAAQEGGSPPSMRVGIECAAAASAGELALDPELVLGLEAGLLSAELRAPARARLGSGRSSFALGDLGIEGAARLWMGEAFLSFGASIAAPTGPPAGAPLDTARPTGWAAGLGLEATAILDPAAAAARLEARLRLPRRGEGAGALLELGGGLSLAEALNARISLGLSARLAAWFPMGSGAGGDDRGAAAATRDVRFGGGASAGAAWRGEGLTLSAGLSSGFGAEAAGPALAVGAAYEFDLPRPAAPPP